jgi:Regulator of chromosome condensation (RCC1) repeat
MHFTRRLLDPHRSGLFVAFALLAVGAMAASCSSSDEPAARPRGDAGVDAPSTTDAADGEATTPRDAGIFDAAPLPVVCTSHPCATSLVTTLGTSENDRAEGFCVLLDDGTVACWGANGAGQLGRGEDGELLDSANAAKVVGLSDIVSLDHTCAVDESGGVWCWGTGPFRWSDAGATTTTETTPVKLQLPFSTKVGLSYRTACAVVSDGVSCWGDNANGQLGPLTETFTGEPQHVPLPPGAPVRALDVGNATFVLREDGSLVTWGGNPGIGRVSPSSPDPYPQLVPLERITTTDLAYDNGCVTANGIAYCWGVRVNTKKGTVVDRALPEPVVAPEPIVQISTTRTSVAPSGALQPYRWCGVAGSGTVYCWGFNESGQAGDGTQDYVFKAVKVDGLTEPAAQVKTTPNTTCALLTNGKVHCWGSNYTGQLGNGLNRGRSLVPTEVVLP